jgi:hypothetical protein
MQLNNNNFIIIVWLPVVAYSSQFQRPENNILSRCICRFVANTRRENASNYIAMFDQCNEKKGCLEALTTE